jgi:L-serine deaminase
VALQRIWEAMRACVDARHQTRAACCRAAWNVRRRAPALHRHSFSEQAKSGAT